MFAVVMAGGSGTRFWPASRAALPKQFLKITGRRSMLEETLARVEPLASGDRVLVVVGAAHEAETLRLIGDTGARVLVEPVGRNTAACIGLAALHVRRADPDAAMFVLPADHFIADAARFRSLLEAAAEVARQGPIVTLGIQPTRPETGYGYIAVGAERGQARGEARFAVERFVEKPDLDTALGYLAAGRYLWNSGIFVFTPRRILRDIEACMPDLHSGLEEIDRHLNTPDEAATLARVYPRLAAVSIDYGVMEKTAEPVEVLRADFGWSDVGSWQALYELRQSERDADGNLLLGEARTADARENLVYSTTGRVVALLGVEGLMVVDTPDALLVADLNRSQDVKQFPEDLKRTDRADVC